MSLEKRGQDVAILGERRSDEGGGSDGCEEGAQGIQDGEEVRKDLNLEGVRAGPSHGRSRLVRRQVFEESLRRLHDELDQRLEKRVDQHSVAQLREPERRESCIDGPGSRIFPPRLREQSEPRKRPGEVRWLDGGDCEVWLLRRVWQRKKTTGEAGVQVSNTREDLIDENWRGQIRVR